MQPLDRLLKANCDKQAEHNCGHVQDEVAPVIYCMPRRMNFHFVFVPNQLLFCTF